MPYNELPLHEAMCIYRQVVCPFQPSCCFVGPLWAYIGHIDDKRCMGRYGYGNCEVYRVQISDLSKQAGGVSVFDSPNNCYWKPFLLSSPKDLPLFVFIMVARYVEAYSDLRFFIFSILIFTGTTGAKNLASVLSPFADQKF